MQDATENTLICFLINNVIGGIKFPMNTCYHLDTLKQIKKKMLSSVEQASCPPCEEKQGLPMFRDVHTDVCSQVRKPLSFNPAHDGEVKPRLHHLLALWTLEII